MNMFGNEYSNRIQKLYCGKSTFYSMAVVVLGSLRRTFYVLFEVYYVHCKKETVYSYGSFRISSMIPNSSTFIKYHHSNKKLK